MWVSHLVNNGNLSFFFKKSLYWICYNIASVLSSDFWPLDMWWDLSFPARDRIHTPCTGRWSLNQWITKEAPRIVIYLLKNVEIKNFVVYFKNCFYSLQKCIFMIKIKMLQMGLQLFLSCFDFCPALNTLWVAPVSSSENVLPDLILCVYVPLPMNS